MPSLESPPHPGDGRDAGRANSRSKTHTPDRHETAGLSSYIHPSLPGKLAGKAVISAGPHEHAEVLAPYSRHPLGRVPLGLEEDVRFAVGQARRAQPAWAATTLRERAAVFFRFHDLLLERQDEVLDLIQLETGKARIHAFEEVLDTAGVARYYARAANRLLRPSRRQGALPVFTSTREVRSPIGVTGFITPWNYPLTLAITDAIPALIAGNAAVVKPDLQTSFTALWAADLLREAGLPPDVLNVVTGEGSVAGPAVAANVDYVMFTGSTRVGRLVARQAAERLIGCSLELGGKNPMLVLEDADVEKAVAGALRGCFVGAGQVCISIERLYVHESLYRRFLDRFTERAQALRVGAALDYSVDVGSLTSERQLQTVEDHVRDALDKGAALMAGGRRLPDLGPYFYAPTILANVSPRMKLYAEETFGPVVAVYPFTAEDEAVERANDSRYGLSASIYTRDIRRGMALAGRIRTGSVNINEPYAAAWGSVDAVFGGLKDSGLGHRHGDEGITKFTETRTVAVQKGIPIAPPFGMHPSVWARWMTRFSKLLRWVGFPR